MSDHFEKMLLEAAGRTTTPSRNRHSSPPSRRRRKGSYSDDGSDSKNDDSDGDRAYSDRKPSGSQLPLKKRLDPADRDDDRSSQEGDEDHYRDRDSDYDSVGSDLYKGDDDREKLSKLTELEREMILETRATKRSDRDLTEKLKKRKGPDRKGESGSHSDDGETGDGGMVDSDDDKVESKVSTFEDVKEITIRRSKLAKRYHFLDTDSRMISGARALLWPIVERWNVGQQQMDISEVMPIVLQAYHALEHAGSTESEAGSSRGRGRDR